MAIEREFIGHSRRTKADPLLWSLISGSAVVAAFWLTVPPQSGARSVQLALSAVAILGLALSRFWPLLGALTAGLATAGAWEFGMTSDPFLLASFGVFALALKNGTRRAPWWLLLAGGGVALAALLLGRPVGAVPLESNDRGVLLGTVVLGAAWVLGARTREADELAAAQIRHDERMRIARDTHDVLSHSLGAIGVQAGVAAHVETLTEHDLQDALRDIEARSRQALSELHTLLRAERAQNEHDVFGTLDPEWLVSLEALVTTARQLGIESELNVTGELSQLDSQTGAIAHRVVQEAVTNTIRHSSADSLIVSVVTTLQFLEISVFDNGPNTACEVREGYGLTGLRERVETAGGNVRFAAAADGFAVWARLPVRAAAGQPR